MKSVKDKIYELIKNTGQRYALHEITIPIQNDDGAVTYANAHAISTRLNDLVREGKLQCEFRIKDGRKLTYKEWYVPETNKLKTYIIERTNGRNEIIELEEAV